MTHKNGSGSAVLPYTQIEAMQTVPPYKVTDPRQVWKISGKEPIGSWIFNGSLNIVVFFNKEEEEEEEEEEDSGWLTAGWIKESLGKALRDEPILSGRLRRCEDNNYEIVSNDSGARLFEATIDCTLNDFLALDLTAESKLVFWKDVDQLNPQFSPLFYVQVTNFQCGGYSVGIGCSVLFANILIMDNFLQKWTTIHKDIVKNNEKKLPTFYLPSLKPPSVNLNSLFTSTTRDKSTQTVIFNIRNTVQNLENNFALICLEEAENQLGISKTTSNQLDFLVKESEKIFKAENCKISEYGHSHLENNAIIELKSSDLKDCFAVSFREGRKPERVSYWMSSVNGQVQAIAIPSDNKLGEPADLNIILTIPFPY